MQMPEIVTVFMEEMRDKGIAFALDDFGAGHTMFRHLRHLCFDMIKIDGQFARAVDSDPDNQVLCEGLVALAHSLGMLVVSEAVETPAEATWLQAAGVDLMQGYCFGAPSMTPPWARPDGG
jgi:EAL domain-containing protein (putative c-di-GMP-specific phosphodiesterase class I)